nr:JUN-1E [Caenorhabditis elegans]
MLNYQPPQWMNSLMNSNIPSSLTLTPTPQFPTMFSSTSPYNFCTSDSSSSPISADSTPKSSPFFGDANPKFPFFNFMNGDSMALDDQEKKKLERKRARNRQAATKCRQKKMDRIKELEEQVLHEKHRGQRLDAELLELNRALEHFRRTVEHHSGNGCPNNSIRV